MPEAAIAAARRALELDDSLAEAHRALAFAEFYGSWEFVDAEKEFHRAYPTREEFLVAAPAVVESKARYGLGWFEEQWNHSHTTTAACARMRSLPMPPR